eukprot:GFUD01031276.1.p1 GENE.GFUD01031276.1~~GFUD01031276.1.p1  ORF type:complete len:310 (-),score=90.85 GFUD01031276.1:208-1137(-)
MSSDESLIVLKDCKRVVELRYKSVLVEKSELDERIESLTQQSELLQVKNQSLEERLAHLENEKTEQTEILAEIQQNLIQKTSEYESQIRSMQVELDKRLDEIDVSQKEDVDKVKGHYIELFDEKASEVMSLRNDLEKSTDLVEEYRKKCTDLEYREEELNDLVNKMRTDPMKAEESDVKHKLEASYSKTLLLQDKLDKIKIGFEEMKTREKERNEKFELSVEELHLVISDKDREILKLTQNMTKEKTPAVLNINNESHSSHKLSTHGGDDHIDKNNLVHNPEVGSSSDKLGKTEGKVKNKRKGKKKRNL